MKKKLLSALIALTMVLSVISPIALPTTVSADAAPLDNYNISISSPYAAPTVTPPAGEHPRVMVRDVYVNKVRENWDDSENSEAVAEFERLANASIDVNTNVGTLNEDNGYKRDQLRLIEAKAFDYLLNKDNEDTTIKERARANGSNAVLGMDKFLSTASYASGSDVCRESGYAIFVASEVYDWCYDKMIKNDYQYAKNFIYWCETLMSSGNSAFEVNYPPNGGRNITGHAGEYMIFRDMLAFAIAIYDEKPSVYNYVMGRIESEMAPARKWFYESGAPYQGDSYGAERYLGELYAETLIEKMTYTDSKVFIDSNYKGFKKVPRHWLYMHRPDGRLFTRGDDFTIAGGASGYNTKNFFAVNFMAGNLFKDGYVKGESFRRTTNFASDEFQDFRGITSVKWLIMNDPSITTKKTDRSALDQNVYFGSPSGEIIAKTSWAYGVHNSNNDYMNNDAAAAYMRIGEYYGGNHDDLDSGSFQLYYKGILASASGNYDDYSSDHNVNYRKRTISHNALTVSSSASLEDNDAGDDALKGFFSTYETSNGWWTTGTAVNPHANDGGQRIAVPEINSFSVWQNASGKYKRATVIDHYVSDDYSYIKGNLTPAYAPAKLDSGVPVIRNMAFVETGNSSVPAFMIVYDKLKGASNSNVPQFNLHTQAEPTISGNTTTVVSGGGKMTVKTLLPASASITKLGGSGNQYKVAGTNYAPTLERTGAELGWGRIEIKPSTVSGTTEFLNVLAVSDAGYTSDIPATTIEGTNVKGAKVLDQVVLFSTNESRVNNTASFTVSGSDTDLNMKVLGIQPGYWLIAKDGETVAMKQVEEEEDGNGATLDFTGDAGTYTLTFASSEVHWLNVHTEDFEGTNGHKWWGCFDDMSGALYRSSPSGTNNTGDNLGDQVVRIPQSTSAYRELCVVTDASKTFYEGTSDEVAGGNPYLKAGYTEDQLKLVRLSLDVMKTATDRTTNIQLVGKKNGEIVKQERTVGFNKDGKIYINGTSQEYGRRSLGSYAANKWYKIVMEIDCLTDTYKVGIGSGDSLTWLDADGLDLDFDCILGVDIIAKKEGSSTTKITYADNIAFDVLMTGAVTTSNVTLNTNGGTINAGNVTEYTEGEVVQLPTNVTKSGYVFGGWYENSSFTGSAVSAIPANATGDKTYYAKWLAVYTVTLETNGGTVNAGNVSSYTEGEGASLPTDVTKPGCTFLGWYDNAGLTGSQVTGIPSNATGNKIFYAKWELETYTITYEPNGGIISGTPTASYTAGSSVALPQEVTRSGFTFAGWYSDSQFSEGPLTAIPASAIGNKTLYARYTKNGRSDAEITDHYIVAASEDFDAYTVDDSNYYTGTFADGFANLGGTADYTSYISANPYGEARGNVLGLRHPKSGTSVYWGMNAVPTIPQGARGDFKKIKFSFDTARGFGSQSNYQLDLIMDGRDSSDNELTSQVLVRISKGRSINYMNGSGEAVLTGVTMPQNDWTHIDVYVDTENHLLSLYQDSLPLAENIVLTGDLASFDEVTGFRFKSVTTSGATETHAEYLDNVKFAVLASAAKVRPTYTNVYDLDFNSSPYEYYSTPDAGMVANGSAYICDDPAGISGKVMRLRHTKSTVSAEMAASGAGSALGSNSKDEFRRVKFGFDHYVTLPDENTTSANNTYYTTDIVIYGDTATETATYTGIGMFAENATVKLYDGATTKAVSTYGREKWQRIEFYVDCLSGTYDAYLDGHIIAEGFALPAEFQNVYKIRISAHKLDSATNSYTYIDNLSFSKSTAVSEGITLSADYEQEDEQFAYNVNASGFTSSENAYILIGLYNSDGSLMYYVRKEAFTGNAIFDEDEITGLPGGAYLKAFAWDIETMNPLGDPVTVTAE